MPRLRLGYVGICVSDWRRSLRFYRDLLGFRYVSELDVAGEPSSTFLQVADVDLHAVYLEREGVRIELLDFAKPGHTSGPRSLDRLDQPGLTHLSLQVDDLDVFLSSLAAAEVDVLTHPRLGAPDGRDKATFVTDPDGTLIELVQRPGA